MFTSPNAVHHAAHLLACYDFLFPKDARLKSVHTIRARDAATPSARTATRSSSPPSTSGSGAGASGPRPYFVTERLGDHLHEDGATATRAKCNTRARGPRSTNTAPTRGARERLRRRFEDARGGGGLGESSSGTCWCTSTGATSVGAADQPLRLTRSDDCAKRCRQLSRRCRRVSRRPCGVSECSARRHLDARRTAPALARRHVAPLVSISVRHAHAARGRTRRRRCCEWLSVSTAAARDYGLTAVPICNHASYSRRRFRGLLGAKSVRHTAL